MNKILIKPNPDDKSLTREIEGFNQNGEAEKFFVVEERPLTLYLNGQEIITHMTICDYPEYLVIGYLLNQNMLHDDDEITDIEYDKDIDVIVVRTKRQTNYEEKLKKKIHTSGCAQGTMFGDIMENIEDIKLDAEQRINASWITEILKQFNTMDSLYLKAGAIHGCGVCEGKDVLIYMEDVGRHNAVDKITGYMWKHKISSKDKIFYTTGRLTSEMVIKCIQMGISVLISRSGFTAWGVEIAKQAGLTLIGRARGSRFTVLSGNERIIYDNGK
ncbi:MAG: formate dehydrogenase accessory sulfurtransferase FdhD [Alphaproteobacteria bacterium]